MLKDLNGNYRDIIFIVTPYYKIMLINPPWDYNGICHNGINNVPLIMLVKSLYSRPVSFILYCTKATNVLTFSSIVFSIYCFPH